jgi:hypothetical protein
MSFSRPVTEEVLAGLGPAKARQLAVWSRNHAKVFDLRLHSLKTCPFLAYIPAYLFRRKNTAAWAAFLHDFFRAKHEEEFGRVAAILSPGYRCSCEKELA